MNKLELFIDCSRNENDELCVVNGIRGNNIKLPRLDIFKSSFDSVKDEDIPFGMKEDVSVEEGEYEVSLRFTENLINKTFESVKKFCQVQTDLKKLANKFLEFYKSLPTDDRYEVIMYFDHDDYEDDYVYYVSEVADFPALAINENKDSVSEGGDDTAEEIKEVEIITKSEAIYKFLTLISTSMNTSGLSNVSEILKNDVKFVESIKKMIDAEFQNLNLSDEQKALIKFIYKSLIKLVGEDNDEFLKSLDDVEKYKNLIFKIPKIHAIMTNAIIDDLVVIGIKKFPVMKLIQEVDRSVDEKKDIYIVENYEDYYNNVVRKSNPEYKYIRFDYGTVEWSDVVLDLKDNEGMNLQDRILDGELDFGEMRNLLD